MGVGGLSVGLASGIDYGSLIDSLLSLEKKPIETIQQKVNTNGLKQEAYSQLLNQALGVKLSMFDLATTSTFEKKVVTSSNEAILTATGDRTAATGSQTLQVARLATASVNVSSGVQNKTSTTVGTGTLSFELGGRRLDMGTAIDDLNDGHGIQRGVVTLTDDVTGKSESIDLASAVTVQDMLDLFNTNGMGLTFESNRSNTVPASVNGYSLKITNGGSNTVTMTDINTSTTLKDLGFKTSASKKVTTATSAVGSQIFYVTEATKLNGINDGFGILTNDQGTNDMRFYVTNTVSGAKKAVEVDLSGTNDVGDVLNTINAAMFNAKVNAYSKARLSSDGVSIEFTGTVSSFQNINGSRAATDLGLDKIQLDSTTSTYKGEALIAEMGSSLIRNLNGGHGIENLSTGTFKIQSRSGNTYDVQLNGAVSLSDITRIISNTTDNSSGLALTEISAEINENGNGITILDSSTGDNTFRIDDMSGDVAAQLGIETTFAIEPVLFNPIDLTNDSSGNGRLSVAYFSKNSLPEGITENDLVGRSIENTWSSKSASGKNSTESARIISFDKAPDDLAVTPIEATASSSLTMGTTSSPYGGNSDTIIDQTNLNSVLNANLAEDFMVGATFNVYTNTGLFSSTIIAYDSTTKQITLADDALSVGGITATELEDFGYSINYNNKIILEYQDPDVLSNVGVSDHATLSNTFLDAKLFAGTSAIDASRMIGATITTYDTATSTEYSAIVTAYDELAPTEIKLDNDTLTSGLGLAALLANGYAVTYTPIQFASNGNSNFLSTNSGNVDSVKIVGVGNNSEIVGKNLENRMMSGVTRLDDLNGGKGIGKGIMRISVAGTSAEIDLDQDSIQTVQDLIDEIKGSLSNIAVEINDRGDGLRIYDTSTTSTSDTLSVSDVGSTSASDLNLTSSSSSRSKVNVTSGADFYSYKGVATSWDGTNLVVPEFVGLNKSEVIGSKITYTDGPTGLLVHAIVLDYNIVAGNAQLTLGGLSTEAENAGGASIHEANSTPLGILSDPTNATSIQLQLKKHFSNYEYFSPIANATYLGSNDGKIQLEIDSSNTDYAQLSEEELVGSMINIMSNISGDGFDKVRGMTGMIIEVDLANNFMTVQTTDMDANDVSNFVTMIGNAGVGNTAIGISKNEAPNKQLQAGSVTTANSFLTTLATSGYKSLTASVNVDSVGNTIISDQFINLNPSDIIGSLVTVGANSASGEGQVAIVTGYNSASNAITVGGFYDPTVGSPSTSLNLSANDEIFITYAKELEGAVIRANASSFSNGAAATDAQINTSITNKKLLQIDNIISVAGSEDQLIGSTITFLPTTGTIPLQGEIRTIIDIIHDYGGVSGNTVLVLDEELPVAAAAGNVEKFTISANQVKATIDHVDFASGVISTREKMTSAIGGRDFTIHSTIDGSYQKEINVLSTDTLTDITDRINGAGVGVKANIINDGSSSNPYRLSITALQTGDRGAVNVSSTVTGFDFNLATRGQDAKVIVGSDTGSSSVVSSSSNTVTDAIGGITLKLHQASRENVTLTIDHDKEGITEKATTIIEEVNLLLKSANDLIALETEVEVTNEDGSTRKEKQKGLLFGDVATRSMINEIKSLLTRLVQGVPNGGLNSWSDIGITLTTNGTQFEFDSSVLQSALDSKFDQVKDLFTTNPNLGPNSSVSVSDGFLQSNYNINNLRNGDISSSGFSETGNGTNGVKLKAGSTGKYVTYSFGEVKNLYGMRLHHFIPEDLTARLSIGSANATSASISGFELTDSGNLGESAKIISDQIIGATLTVGSSQATITGYDAATSTLTFDTAIADNPNTGYIITSASGETLNFQHNVIVEYRDPTTNTYKTYQTYRNRDNGTMSVVFPSNLRTDSVRIRYDNNTGDSQDFTENGYYVRLMEMEVLDSQGIGAQFNRSFAGFTDSNTGSISLANKTLDTLNNAYAKQVLRLTDSLNSSQDRYIKQFQNLEQIVSSLNSQSSYFQSQISSLPSAFSYRGNNK